MIDYVLVNRRFHTSVLDTRVYQSAHLESDHELVVSTFQFKIKAKRHKQVSTTKYQTRSLPQDVTATVASTLAESLEKCSGKHLSVDEKWSSFKQAFYDASSSLPRQPVQIDPDC